jgi:hypothetical protein
MHYKIDLFTDAQLADYSVQPGDVLTLDVPNIPGIAQDSQTRVSRQMPRAMKSRLPKLSRLLSLPDQGR